MNKFLKTGLLLTGTVFAGLTTVRAQQVYPYFVDFETDSIKAYATATPFNLNGINWNMPGVFLGDMVATSDKFNGQHAARVRRDGNATGNNGTLTMQADLLQGIGTVTLWSGRYGTETGSTFAVFVSTDHGVTWSQVGSPVTPAATLTSNSFIVNTALPARISIRKTDTSASRFDIDDIMITGNNNYATNVVMTNKTPLGIDVPLATDTLTIKFNDNVTKGTGNIVLHNVTDNSVQTKAVTSTDVFINGTASGVGQTVTIKNIALGNNKDYYVTYDASAFVQSTGSLTSTGITADSVWRFSTIDTTAAATITSLNETFTTCADPVIGVFKYYSVTGTQTWRCSVHGNTDNASAYINGGFSGGANDNEDWLITNAKVDISATSNATLGFYMENYYSGTTSKMVYASTNYPGFGDPTTSTWTLLKDVSSDASTTWTPYSAISLAAYQNTPFYLAFKYMSFATSGGAQEWSIDDIKITSSSTPPPTAIADRNVHGLGLAVLGTSTSNEILLGVSLRENGPVNITVFDAAGRKVFNSVRNMEAGANQYRIGSMDLNKGLYIIHVNQGNNYGVVKTIVE
jgi:hypothetical protein